MVGAAYALYSSRFQDSVTDQVRAVFADAVRKGVFIPLDHVFLDLAVRGVKNDRPGLNALRACLDRKTARVVFFFATNRLFRKTYGSLQFVEEQVVEKGVRAVFVKSGVDTADARRWRALLNMHAMMDEFVVGSTADHVRAAHERLLEKRLVFGTVSFGYAGRPLVGQTTRRGKTRMTLVVDEVAGGWVRRVFAWYVGDRLPIAEVVRRLNSDLTAPPPPKSPNRTWTHDAVLQPRGVALGSDDRAGDGTHHLGRQFRVTLVHAAPVTPDPLNDRRPQALRGYRRPVGPRPAQLERTPAAVQSIKDGAQQRGFIRTTRPTTWVGARRP